MISWRRAAERFAALPALAQVGLGLFGGGAAGDLVYHGLPAATAEALWPLLGQNGERAHLLTFLGMVVLFLGLVQRSLQHGR